MPLAAVGYLDGTLAIYDLSTQTLRHQCQHQVQAPVGRPRPLLASTPDLAPAWSCLWSMCPPSLPEMPPSSPPLASTLPLVPVQSGIVQLLWEAGTAVVYTCSLDGIVRLWDARTGRLLTDYRGHTAEILDFALSK